MFQLLTGEQSGTAVNAVSQGAGSRLAWALLVVQRLPGASVRTRHRAFPISPPSRCTGEEAFGLLSRRQISQAA
jgi:hypothetical protein